MCGFDGGLSLIHLSVVVKIKNKKKKKIWLMSVYTSYKEKTIYLVCDRRLLDGQRDLLFGSNLFQDSQPVLQAWLFGRHFLYQL